MWSLPPSDTVLHLLTYVALTSNAMTGDREKALAAGCDDFDTKPVEYTRLVAKIEGLLQKRKAG